MHKVILKKNHWVWQDRSGNKETCCPNLMTRVQSRVWSSGPTWLPQAVTWLHMHIAVHKSAHRSTSKCRLSFLGFFFLKENHETGDMAQWVRTHIALTVVPSQFPSTLSNGSKSPVTPALGNLTPLASVESCTYVHISTPTYRGTHTNFFLFLWDRVSLCRLGWTGPSAYATQVLILKVCITTSGSIFNFFSKEGCSNGTGHSCKR